MAIAFMVVMVLITGTATACRMGRAIIALVVQQPRLACWPLDVIVVCQRMGVIEYLSNGLAYERRSLDQQRYLSYSCLLHAASLRVLPPANRLD